MKKLLAILVAFLLCTSLSAPAFAVEVIDSGQCGDTVTWALTSDNILTISGTGKMYDYKFREVPWWEYEEIVKQISIGPEIQSIGSYAFDSFIEITSVTLPPSITYIGDNAFYACHKLTSINIPEGVTKIDEFTFAGCYELKNISLPSSLTEIGYMAFLYCESLSTIDIPQNVSKIDISAFEKCSNLTEVNLPDRLEVLRSHTFYDCKNLSSIVIPKGISKLQLGTFENCTNLKSITLPNTLKVIGESVFQKCSSLTDIYYQGTEEQWEQVQIDHSWSDRGPIYGNSPIMHATIHFSSEENEHPTAWATAEVEAAIAADLIPEFLQQHYTQPVTRVDVARMFINLLEKSSGRTAMDFMFDRGMYGVRMGTFTDTDNYDVLQATALGIIKGVGDNKFDPYGTLTRAQIAAIINRTANLLGKNTGGYTHGFTDVTGHWVESELGWPVHAKVINGIGDNKFDPDSPLTTEQAIVIAYRALQALKTN